MKEILIRLITIYQKTLSRDHGWLSAFYPTGYCRYQPTCSEYAKQSIREHGVSKGIFLGISRISRCHPWGSTGSDPILNRETN